VTPPRKKETPVSYRDDQDGEYTPPKPAPTPAEEEPRPPDESGLPKGYDPQPYPKMIYHPDGRSKTVANELDEDTAELEGFTLDVPPHALPPEVEPAK
jgi:hypothetical protein